MYIIWTKAFSWNKILQQQVLLLLQFVLVEVHPPHQCHLKRCKWMSQALGHFSLWDCIKSLVNVQFVDFVFSDEWCRSWRSYGFPRFWGSNMAQEGKVCSCVWVYSLSLPQHSPCKSQLMWHFIAAAVISQAKGHLPLLVMYEVNNSSLQLFLTK